MVAPELVELVGVVQLQTPLGKPPPIARSKMIEKLWSMAACQVATGTWLSLTWKNWVPSRNQVIDSAEVLVRFTIAV
jgi:hypothetical protein